MTASLLIALLPPQASDYHAVVARAGQTLSRRMALSSGLLTGVALPLRAEDSVPDFNRRGVRGMGLSSALIPGDYYYIYGVVPPRKISAPNVEQPQWNTFGACVENSCTYVPIAQRYQAYSKYEGRLHRGLRAYQELKESIAKNNWDAISQATSRDSSASQPLAPAIDALLKAGLLASAMLVSPNNLREKREQALATFYVNEASYALERIATAATARDSEAALAAWDFGKDSWNSYLAVINRAVVPKVGEPFELIV